MHHAALLLLEQNCLEPLACSEQRCPVLEYVNTANYTLITARGTTEQYDLCCQLLLNAYGCLLAALFLSSKHLAGGGGAGLPRGRRLEPERFPDGGHGAVQAVDRGTPEAECQWWADWLGDEW